MSNLRTVVVGVGNPTLTDDGVGLVVAESLRQRLAGREPVAVKGLCAGGLRLMEAMVGFQRAIVVDAMVGRDEAAGTTVEFDLGGHDVTRNLDCTHDMGLPQAIALGRQVGVDLPEEIRVFGIAAADVTTYSEQLTPAVAAAVEPMVEQIMQVLTEPIERREP